MAYRKPIIILRILDFNLYNVPTSRYLEVLYRPFIHHFSSNYVPTTGTTHMVNFELLLWYNSLPCGTECCSRMAVGIRPTSKKKKTFIVGCSLRLSSHGTLRDLFLLSRWPRELVASVTYTDIFIYFSAHKYCWMLIFGYFI